MANVLSLQLLPVEQSPIGGECPSSHSCISAYSSNAPVKGAN